MARAHSPAEPSVRRPGRVKQWWLDRSVRAKAMTVLAVPLIALIGTSSTSLALEHQERTSRAASIKAFDLITTGNQVLADAVNGETGVRGYVATGNQIFLQPYNLALSRIGPDRRAFRAGRRGAGRGRPAAGRGPRAQDGASPARAAEARCQPRGRAGQPGESA